MFSIHMVIIRLQQWKFSAETRSGFLIGPRRGGGRNGANWRRYLAANQERCNQQKSLIAIFEISSQMVKTCAANWLLYYRKITFFLHF